MLTNTQVRFNQIQQLSSQPALIRNISIIAHVDHGKTTLSDQLISSNNIISRKLAGRLRYLDSRPDEQLRGITMKSSSISIVYDERQGHQYLINLIDSPGHVEFSSEVSAALRLTDGALILIDVIEGFSSQTYTVLKQMYTEGIRGILVLNKIDRLIMELRMSPLDAFTHLSQIIDQVNATLSSFLQEKYQTAQDEHDPERIVSLDDALIDEEESKLYFAPEKDNIVFCSAYDSWAFTVSVFARIHAAKLGCSEKILQKYLWGNYYLEPKQKRVREKPVNDNQKPMFVEFIANNLWKIYEVSENKDTETLTKMSKALGIEVSTTAQQLLSRWLPMDRVVLQAVVNILPSPVEAQRDRLPILTKKMLKQLAKLPAENPLHEKYRELQRAISSCDTAGPLVLFISKMIGVQPECVNEKGLDVQPTTQRFYGFARLYSGTLRRGQRVYVIGPKSKVLHEQTQEQSAETDIVEVVINHVYIMMAQNLEGVMQASAGNVVAIGDLDDIVFKTATISDWDVCPSFTPITIGSLSLLKTTLQPENIEDQPRLIQGLKKLNKSDPSIEVFNINGDLVLGTCGQVHLQRCITDLEDKMALCKIKVSEPIIAFKETILYNNIFDESVRKTQNKKAKVLQQNKPQQKRQLNKDVSDDVDKERVQKLREEILKEEESEVVNTNEVDAEDLRYNQLRPVEEEPQWNYQKPKATRKIDHKNKSKLFLGKLNVAEVLNQSNLVENLTANQKVLRCWHRQISIKVRAVGVPFELASWLERNAKLMRKLFATGDWPLEEATTFLTGWDELVKEVRLDKRLSELIESSLVCFGPRKHGPNLLISRPLRREDSLFYRLRTTVGGTWEPKQQVQEDPEEEQSDEKVSSTKETSRSQATKIKRYQLSKYLQVHELTEERLINSLALGFDLALQGGPLCEEPMIGACFIVEEVVHCEVAQASEQEEPQQQFEEEATDTYGPLTGQLYSAMKDACLNSFLGAHPRLVESVYKCTLQTDFENYGKAFDVLGQRRAKVLSEILNNSTSMFLVSVHLPLSSSFGFYSSLQVATSGRVTAQLEFDGWVVLETDPFYQSVTEEDYEENGQQVLQKNIARDLIEQTRRRKGLLTEVKIDGEKQRNLSKKK